MNLVYLDPPFKSDQNYNMLYKEQDGSKAAAQIQVFTDTWHWDRAAAATLHTLLERSDRVADMLDGFRRILGTSDMLAYLVMMAPRLVELHRVLKNTGSLYLHCDPTASHYLKLLLDGIFRPVNFRNEVIWRRTRAHNDARLTRFGAIHDVILFYSKSGNRVFNRLHTERDQTKPKSHDLYFHTDNRWYRKGDCRAPGGRGPRYVWNGHEQNWRFTHAERQRLEAEGRIVYTKNGIPPSCARWIR